MYTKKGFTLVELMVVIVILGVLAAVALPKFALSRNKAICSEIPVYLRSINQAQAIRIHEMGTPVGVMSKLWYADDIERDLGVVVTETYFWYWTRSIRNDLETTVAGAVPHKPYGEIVVSDDAVMSSKNEYYLEGAFKKYLPVLAQEAIWQKDW